MVWLNKGFEAGIIKAELANCELRASASGFHSVSSAVWTCDTFGRQHDVGAIVVQRAYKD